MTLNVSDDHPGACAGAECRQVADRLAALQEALSRLRESYRLVWGVCGLAAFPASTDPGVDEIRHEAALLARDGYHVGARVLQAVLDALDASEPSADSTPTSPVTGQVT